MTTEASSVFVRNVRHSSRVELSQTALKKNINFLKKKIGKHPRFSSVVKANAYGHGIPQIVKMLEKAGVHHFSVASAFEAEEVHEHCHPDSEIMIMGILYDEDLEWVIRNQISFFVYHLDRLEKALAVSKRIGIPAKVHLELETGTNRTGMSMKEVERAITILKRNREHLFFEGFCTHFGGAESMSNQFKIEQQKVKFKEGLKVLKRRNFLPKYRHTACSAAVLAMPDTHYDLVRVGVSTYGFWPGPDIYYHHLQEVGKMQDTPMSRVISWKTDIMDIKDVPKGDFIGYGTSYQAVRDMRVAALPIGYSNGYPRGQSNSGYVLIHGRKAPIVGLINMNVTMVDVSHLPGVKISDEVVLLGKQKNNTIHVSSFTNYTRLLNNEMLSRLPTAIPREIKR